ncbi:MAG: sugar kinase [Sneathiella sp.]
MKIACIGEAMLELSLGSDLSKPQLGFAGDTLNTAIYLRRCLSSDHEVAFVSRVGKDMLSETMLAFIESESITTRHISKVGGRSPGLYAISTDQYGERSFSYWRENSAARLLFQDGTDANFDQLAGFDILYLSAISLAILPNTIRLKLLDWIKQYRARGGITIFDSNYRPQLWESKSVAQEIISAAWANCDIALPSLEDELTLFEDNDEASVIHRLNQLGIKMGVLKRGEKGPMPLGSHKLQDHNFLPVQEIVDSTAAGDSFNGAFIGALITGQSHEDAILAGHLCASKVLQFKGAIIPVSE